MRGKATSNRLRMRCAGITPAYAGKSYVFGPSPARSWDHPRVCGEKVYKDIKHVAAMGSPPRMRGKVSAACLKDGTEGITPAYAGKRCLLNAAKQRTRDHPRVCGEKIRSAVPIVTLIGSPPRMRGKVIKGIVSVTITGITPAYAGKSGCILLLRTKQKDHPRVCGEKNNYYDLGQPKPGSPPRMRGKD